MPFFKTTQVCRIYPVPPPNSEIFFFILKNFYLPERESSILYPIIVSVASTPAIAYTQPMWLKNKGTSIIINGIPNNTRNTVPQNPKAYKGIAITWYTQ